MHQHSERSLKPMVSGWNLNARDGDDQVWDWRKEGGNLDARLALVHAVLIQPRAVLLVHALDVVEEPIVQETEQIAHLHGLPVLQTVNGLLESCQKTLMLGAVPGQSGEAMLRQTKH